MGKQKTAVGKLNAEIARRNVEFKRAGAAKKRVLIAEDVLAVLRKKKIQTQNAGYFDIEDAQPMLKYFPEKADQKKAFQLALHDPLVLENCQACALGACFISIVRLNDSVKPNVEHGVGVDGNYLYVASSIRGTLKKFFSRGQLILIEAAFEGSDAGMFGMIDDDELCEVTKSYLQKYKEYSGSDDKRMAAIMKNIVANKGTFVPVLQKVTAAAPEVLA